MEQPRNISRGCYFFLDLLHNHIRDCTIPAPENAVALPLQMFCTFLVKIKKGTNFRREAFRKRLCSRRNKSRLIKQENIFVLKKQLVSITVPLALSLLVLASTACSAAATQAPKIFSDPFAYCAAVGQIDAPDARYTGPRMSAALFKDYLTAAKLDANMEYPDQFKEMTIWRCMEGRVYACNFGANIPCDSKANTDKTPTQAISDYCKSNPDVDFIPMAVTGHNVIYSWRCKAGMAELADQIDTVDAAGYQSSFWVTLQPGQ